MQYIARGYRIADGVLSSPAISPKDYDGSLRRGYGGIRIDDNIFFFYLIQKIIGLFYVV